MRRGKGAKVTKKGGRCEMDSGKSKTKGKQRKRTNEGLIDLIGSIYISSIPT